MSLKRLWGWFSRLFRGFPSTPLHEPVLASVIRGEHGLSSPTSPLSCDPLTGVCRLPDPVEVSFEEESDITKLKEDIKRAKTLIPAFEIIRVDPRVVKEALSAVRKKHTENFHEELGD